MTILVNRIYILSIGLRTVRLLDDENSKLVLQRFRTKNEKDIFLFLSYYDLKILYDLTPEIKK